ncbi:MAG TPA: carboxypeptidase regulatory-like domain-containing protein [Sphingobacteriaceae bacterium]
MRFLTIYSLVFIFITSFSKPGFSQQADTVSLNSIITKVQKFTAGYPAEKVHLHFDKPYYAVGDTIWFKAYITSGLHQPTQLSKIVYVDVISSQDSLVNTLKLPVSQGIAWGNIALAAHNYKQGSYYIRAYTRWMMNFDPEYFFTRTINVGNSEKKVSTHISFNNLNSAPSARIIYKDQDGKPYANKPVTYQLNGSNAKAVKGTTDQNGVLIAGIPGTRTELSRQSLTTTIDLGNKEIITNTFPLISADKSIDLQFFPEGGEIINGIPVKVAFKALKTDGKGIDIKGTITDNEGKVVSDFASSHLGMGAFILAPEANKTYTAKITSPAGYSGTYNLPEVKTSGITLSVSNTSADNLGLKILCNNDFLAANQGKNFYLVARVGETICYAAQTLLQKQVYTAAIPKDKFPTGIVEITLFAANSEPLSERLVFVRRKDALDLSLKTDKTTYGRRQKVKLTVGASNSTTPAEAHVSVSVIDETKVPFDENSETTILSNLLLTSDLKGYVEKPNYYFNRPTEKTDQHLDILMLTQGYRRFLYKDIIAGKKPEVYFLPEQGIEISGILRTSNGMPINKGNVKLKIADKYFTAYAVTDGGGAFKFSNLVIPDSSEVIVSSMDYRYKNPMLTIDQNAFLPVVNSIKRPDEFLNIDSAMNPYLLNNKRKFKNSLMLKEVVIVGRSNTNAPSHADYPALTGLSPWPDHLITKDRFANCPSFLNCITTLSMGTTYDNQQFYITRDYNAGNRTPMQVFYNGMPVDANYLASINSNDIESVEVFLKDQLGLVNRSYNSNGVIVVNGKKIEKKTQMSMDEIRKLLPKSGEVKLMPQGYTVSREFYSPKYAATTAAMSNDLRTTIYWNPKIKTDKVSGASVLEFYNSDSRGTYRVIVEGMDAEGHIGRSVYRYKVD